MTIITGTDGNDVLNGTPGDDTINGLGGNDVITDPGGTNTILGGDGDDLITTSGTDMVDGGNGHDTWISDQSNWTGSSNYTLIGLASGNGGSFAANVETMQIKAGDGDNHFYIGNIAADISVAAGGGHNSLLIYKELESANQSYNIALGNDGKLVVDALIAGSFSLHASSIDNVAVSGGPGDDVFTVEYSPNIQLGLYPDEGTDTLNADFVHQPDAVYNSRFSKFEIFHMRLGSGSNTITTGALDDTIKASTGYDWISGGNGHDTVTIDGLAQDFLIERQADGGLVIRDLNQADGDQGIDFLHGIETLSFNDRMLDTAALPSLPVIEGTAAADRLEGTTASEIIKGLAGDDVLIGSGGDDRLMGGGGNDRLDGGAGNDTADYSDSLLAIHVSLADSGVQHTGGSGRDHLASIENLAGGSGNDHLAGDSGQNILSGAEGQDRLYGMDGSDLLFGGNGRDLLDGGEGADRMLGGGGNDTYIVDNVHDVVVEFDVQGYDTVIASVSFTLSGNVEALVLAGSAPLDGTGNDLFNHIYGNSGDNVIDGRGGYDRLFGFGGHDILKGGEGYDMLDGGTGADDLFGGAGDDTYIVDDAGDTVTEQANEGVDLVKSSVSFVLGANLENLTLTGMQATNATGNALNNILIGNDADNMLTGGGGNDRLIGGLGSDLFHFLSPALNGTDKIVDFVSGTDHLLFDAAGYGFEAGHVLDETEFHLGRSPIGTGSQFFFDTTRHMLFFDGDGTGSGPATALASFSHAVIIQAHDIMFS